MSQSSPVATFRSAPPLAQAVLVTGVLAFIASFFPWYGFSYHGIKIGDTTIGGGSYTWTAWHSYSVLALLLMLIATAVAAVVIFVPHVVPDSSPVGATWAIAAVAVLAALLELLRVLTLHHGDGLSIRWGGWVLLILMIAQAVCAVMWALRSGEAAPWAQSSGGSATTGAVPPATEPPPAPPAPPAV
jgi:Family of unknown function (DUF5336)